MKKSKTNNTPAKHYFNISQLRTETWHTLKNTASRLHRKGVQPALQQQFEEALDVLKILEPYWAYPGLEYLGQLSGMYKREEYQAITNLLTEIVQALVSEAYRDNPEHTDTKASSLKKKISRRNNGAGRAHYFEVLFVDDLSSEEVHVLKQRLKDIRDDQDQFMYESIMATTFQDALLAILFNPNIQACVIRYGIPFKSKRSLDLLRPFASQILDLDLSDKKESELGHLLGERIKLFRPELDLYYVADTSVAEIGDSTLECFSRIFYRKEDLQELHLCIQRAIKQRYETPFFSALIEYSQKPTGVFHAMPISRGNSVFKSGWIKDFGDFYGRNLFLAETSATTGGLDSLLQPTGPLKKAQEMAAKAYGSQHTYFVTNGTSTANKIVMQGLVAPGDLVLIDRDCHKSHHYGLVLSGAYPVYLDSYPVVEYSMYGAVPLEHILEKLEEIKKAGQLDKVKMLILTNCTFDGIVYNVEKVTEAILAIKPDMIFLWDEAWFAFAGFTPNYKQRTAMFVAHQLRKKYESDAYREQYALRAKNTAPMPDPDQVKIRVYSTQSTHKTLSALRQGSMIHIYDEEFKRKSEDSFHEAYMTHTSTSPNYQILGSLDAGRRQVQFEGYEMVEKSIEMAMVLRSKIDSHPKLNKYFEVLTVRNFIPLKYRSSGIAEYFKRDSGWSRMEEAWAEDEFVLDPTKINLHIGKTGVDGDTFKNKYLMDKFGIQINKTSRNTVLFMTNIGTTRSSVAYLISVLLQIAQEIEDKIKSLTSEEIKIHNDKVHSLTEENPPLPDFSYFHQAFQPFAGISGGNLRAAYFLAYQEQNCEHIRLEDCVAALATGRQIVSASFVIPYPPGFPILVPGQVLSEEILEFFCKIDVKEVHGYRPDLGLRIFTEAILEQQTNGISIKKKESNGTPLKKRTTTTTKLSNTK